MVKLGAFVCSSRFMVVSLGLVILGNKIALSIPEPFGLGI